VLFRLRHNPIGLLSVQLELALRNMRHLLPALIRGERFRRCLFTSLVVTLADELDLVAGCLAVLAAVVAVRAVFRDHARAGFVLAFLRLAHSVVLSFSGPGGRLSTSWSGTGRSG
jgi:hypothetical protein